ncbi:MAG: pseudouridine synthase [Roseimicrobium sp.]
MVRLNRYLSSCGLGSRRGCEALITEGRVRVNGQVCTVLSTSVGEGDEVVVDGRKARPEPPVVIALHKPKGFVCSRDDERDRRTLYDLLPEKFHTLHHVGRLDMDSQGLILLTNQGELSQKLLHPSKGVEKEYEVTVEERFDPEKLSRLTKGFHTEDGIARAERAWMIGDYKLGLVLKQGFKRQIRNMLYFLEYEVKKLLRVRIGNLSIKGLPEGGWRELSASEVEKLLLNPQSKDRPRLSKPRTASVRKAAETRKRTDERRAPSKKNASAAGSGSEETAQPRTRRPKSSSGTRRGGSKRSVYGR